MPARAVLYQPSVTPAELWVTYCDTWHSAEASKAYVSDPDVVGHYFREQSLAPLDPSPPTPHTAIGGG